jgi:hypothetical protein
VREVLAKQPGMKIVEVYDIKETPSAARKSSHAPAANPTSAFSGGCRVHPNARTAWIREDEVHLRHPSRPLRPPARQGPGGARLKSSAGARSPRLLPTSKAQAALHAHRHSRGL